MTQPSCAVVGVGPGNGAAFARAFDREGYSLALLARSTDFGGELAHSLRDARAIACDVGDPTSVETAFAGLAPEVVIYNAGTGVFTGFDNTKVADFEASWRVNALGAFCVAKQVVPAMKRAGKGTLIFVGATASLRGGPMTSAFAPAKAAQRSFAEALAREFAPAGVHVAVLVIDAVVDLPRTRQRFTDKPDDFFIKPDDIAGAAVALAKQPRSAWTFEQIVRPFGERW
ncbi:MAG TPA: SDR family NAD(P)-dependent oxidoreductase [Kofleriaceae bacterium]|jgi:short-subunit dehydrogenase|nr:SDR family NAD(P)-dependent oxidoreductase [Kofleriaceae bacterium]